MDIEKYHGVLDWIKNSPFVIGFLGSTTALMFEHKLSIKRTFFLLFTGTLCAGYLAPAITELLSFDSQNSQSAMAFLTGTMGMRFVGGLVLLGEKFRRNPTALLVLIANKIGIEYPIKKEELKEELKEEEQNPELNIKE